MRAPWDDASPHLLSVVAEKGAGAGTDGAADVCAMLGHVPLLRDGVVEADAVE